ncbi:MAG: autotransporter outer membrane beta-barrel domain-containing protein, partial [Rhizobiales bacterium]|nr:autotransporter outer membrane beta-barrel domain-containing protein [Hyphomicrobiales bacterium]
RLGAAFVLAWTMLALQPSAARALSTGCAAISNQTFVRSGTSDGTRIGDSFEQGELITVTVTATTAAIYQYAPAGFNFIFHFSGPGTQTMTGVVAETRSDYGFSESWLVNGGGTLTVTTTCGPAPKPNTGSPLLDMTRKLFSKLAAQTSTMQESESVTTALNDAFDGGGTTQFSEGHIATSFAAVENARQQSEGGNDARSAYAAALGYDRLPTKAPSRRVVVSPWHAWIDMRYTGLDNKANTGVDGHQNGNGWNGGGYFGWKFWDRLRLDGMLTYGRLSYGAQADAVTADFGANRITGMLRLSGRWAVSTWYVEPSARVIYARETQDAFTDTAGVMQDRYSFHVGTASVGGEVGSPFVWSSMIVTPTLGLFGDYRFGDDTIATVAALPNLDNGWSARITGGLRWAAANGLSASVGGEYAGVGQDFRYWRLRAALGAKF